MIATKSQNFNRKQIQSILENNPFTLSPHCKSNLENRPCELPGSTSMQFICLVLPSSSFHRIRPQKKIGIEFLSHSPETTATTFQIHAGHDEKKNGNRVRKNTVNCQTQFRYFVTVMLLLDAFVLNLWRVGGMLGTWWKSETIEDLARLCEGYVRNIKLYSGR